MLRPVIGWACALGAAVVLVAFFVGRIASDRWQATQYLHWLPGVPTLLGCAVALGLSWSLWRKPGRLRRLRRVLAAGVLLACAWIGVFEWRLLNAFGGTGGAGLTIMHFNASGKPAPALPGGVLSLDPDVIVFANLRARGSLPATREALSTPEHGASLVHADRFTAVSRATILEFGHTTLGFEGAIFMNRDLPDLRDPGTAAWFRLATKDRLGRDLIVWAIDLPSDPRMARSEMLSKSMDAIQKWTGPTFVRQEGGNYLLVAHEPERTSGFPAPDVIIGDFNTPGGSVAVARFAERAAGPSRRMVDAHASAGMGPDGTFPGFLPRWLGWGIDRAMVSDELKVVRRDVHSVGSAQHRAQRVTISPR